MPKKPVLVQATMRVDRELLREVQYYLSLDDETVAQFMRDKMLEYRDAYRQAHPERVPQGVAMLTATR